MSEKYGSVQAFSFVITPVSGIGMSFFNWVTSNTLWTAENRSGSRM
jgi:hypothetical protein